MWYKEITTIPLAIIFDLMTELNAKRKKTDWIPARDIVGQIPGSRRGITEKVRSQL